MKAHVLITGRVFPRLAATVTLLESEGRRVLVDSGACEDADALVRALAARGLAPEDVDTVVGTHLHYDHCGNHLLFSRARWLVDADDLHDAAAFTALYLDDPFPDKRRTTESLRSRTQAVKTFYLRSIVRAMARNIQVYRRVLDGDPRFVPIRGAQQLTGEIAIVPTPGHTRGHLSVVARGACAADDPDAADLLVAGDALANQRSLTAEGDREIDLAADVAQYRRTRDGLLRAFRYVVPGHGALLDTRAPALVEAVS
jgi:glyoxylase-like metal-dependent hydrolase (beta-lactamase superfamily II)